MGRLGVGHRCTPIIRPIGGALLATRVLGDPSPTFDVAVALCWLEEPAWSPTRPRLRPRLVTNASPEPFSNIALSLAEDVAVVGGLALIHFNPLLALGIFILILAVILYFAPKILRAVRVKLWLIWKKLNGPADGEKSVSLPQSLPSRYSAAFARDNLLGETIAWAVPCICKRLRGVPANVSGILVATNEDPSKLTFVARRRWGARAQAFNVQDCVATARAKVSLRKSRHRDRRRQRPSFPVLLRARSRRLARRDRRVSQLAPSRPTGAGNSRRNLDDSAPPDLRAWKKEVEVRGFEPLAFSLRTRRSTN